MDYRDIQKLIAFFSALKDSGFKQDLKQIPSSAMINGQRTPVDKPYCLSLLRRFPQFQGDKFKDDNAIIRYLSDPNNRKFLLGNFTQAQQIELTKVLGEKPVAAGWSGEQVGSQEASAGQGVSTQVPVGEAGGTMGVPGLPAGPAISSTPRRIFIANQAPPSIGGMEGGTGQGTAATNKANRLEAETNRLNAQTAALQRFNWRSFKMPDSFTNAAKNFGSASQRFTKINLGRIGRGLWEIAKGVGRGIAGPGLTGTYNLLGKAANHGLNAFERLSSPELRSASKSFVSSGSKKLIWGLVGAFFFLVLGVGLIGGLSQTTPSGEAAPVASYPITNLNSCQFTRGDRTPAQESYKSPLLLNYFQEASRISSVPAAVLAAIARVESPTITSKTDADLPSLSSIAGCPRSQTGALGIMQLQPPGTRGGFSAGLELGAGFLGKSLDQLTETDFCDPKTSIILSAGFILKRLELGYGIGDGTKWDPSWNSNQNVIYKVASGYYGCLEYGGGDPLKCSGPYNYGTDIWTSIQSCQQIIASQNQSLGCPVEETITTPYGYNIPGYPNVRNQDCPSSFLQCHNGIDIAGTEGITPVKSTIDGTVSAADANGDEGRFVEITSQDKSTVITLEHLQTSRVDKGNNVTRGSIVGIVGSTGGGSTGSHVHYKIKINGVLVNPLRFIGITDPDSSLLKSSDNLSDNNYAGVQKTNTNYWGRCSSSTSTSSAQNNTASCQTSNNLIQNCGFESSLSGWTNTASYKAGQFSDNLSFTTDAHSGKSAILIGGENAALCQAPKIYNGGDPTPGSFRIFPEVRQYIESSNMNSGISIEFWFKIKSEGTYQVGTNRSAPFYIYIANEETPPYPGKEIFLGYVPGVPDFSECGKGNFSSGYECIIDGGAAFDCSDAFSGWKKININLSADGLSKIGISGKRVYIGFGVTNDFPTAVYLDDVKITSQ
ncbi:M23 family metallopeptidase [Candidatus Daviesbacteria bacterium]|nr:M23 family metallopeptidase [Candidatus Daviesbacteria bacterium]